MRPGLLAPGERGEYGMRRLISLLAVACAGGMLAAASFAQPERVPPRPTKQTVYNEVSNTTATRKQDQDRLNDAAKRLNESLDQTLWIDDFRLQPKGGERVFDREKDAVHRFVEITNDKNSNFDDATLKSWIDRLFDADFSLMRTAQEDAQAHQNEPCFDQNKYDESIAEGFKGEAAYDPDNPSISGGKPEEGIDHFKHGWQKARDSIRDC
jgi:hypothetical protein